MESSEGDVAAPCCPVPERKAEVIPWGAGAVVIGSCPLLHSPSASPPSSLMGHRRNSVGNMEVDFSEHQQQHHRNRSTEGELSLTQRGVNGFKFAFNLAT